MNSYKNLILSYGISRVKKKVSELHKFLMDHNTEIAIITESWLTPKDIFKIPNYKIYRQDWSPTIKNKPRGGVLIAVYKNVPIEDMPQPVTCNIYHQY